MAPIPEFEIFVKNLEGKTKTYKVKNSDTILELKVKIQKEEDILPDNQRLIFAGRQLEDDKTMQESKVTQEVTLHLCLRLRAGMFHSSSGRSDFQPSSLPQFTVKQVQEVEVFDLLALISRLEDELQ